MKPLSWIIASGALSLFIPTAMAQQVVEHPAGSPVAGVPKETYGGSPARVAGRPVPMFWECSITTKEETGVVSAEPRATVVKCLVPLADVEFIGQQNYIVDGNIEVWEVTASMRSKTFLRFYHITEIAGAAWKRLASGAASVDEMISGISGQPAMTPSMQSPRNTKVVKNYPVTTHAQTVEYRVQKREQVEALYLSLRDAFFNYKTFDLVEAQRQATIVPFDTEQKPKPAKSPLDVDLLDDGAKEE